MEIRRPNLHCIFPRVEKKPHLHSFLKLRGEEIDIYKKNNLFYLEIITDTKEVAGII